MPPSRTKVRSTERRNPRTRGLDKLSTRELLRALNREDERVAGAVAREIPNIARAADATVEALLSHGRVFYVGAGTSGRLATLDAAECPPTFGTPSHWIQAIIAGGRPALWSAIEGAEDSAKQGAKDISKRRVTRGEVVVGITASGSTPYVLGALEKSRKAGAVAVGITSNRRSPIARAVDILIAPNTGPEAITGSTRLKAGTAQKLVLNMLSTATMVRLGRVYDNYMVGVVLTNKKLRERGLRILSEATGASVARVKRALRQAGHEMPVALLMLLSNVTAAKARKQLRWESGNIRAALHAVKK